MPGRPHDRLRPALHCSFSGDTCDCCRVADTRCSRAMGRCPKCLIDHLCGLGCLLRRTCSFGPLCRQSVVAPGQDRCFDEMCFAVVEAQALNSSPAAPDLTMYIVTVRATSHSRGRTQAEGGLRARLYSDGEYFKVSEQAQSDYELQHGKTPQITQKLAPGESIVSVLVFAVPLNVTHPGLVLDHGFTPGYFVIGESPFFHAPEILQLPSK